MAFFANKNQVGSTQDILKFAEIRDDTVILKDGNLRQILLSSSINFSLKSEQEQNAIVFQYQGFLNSLNFPIQILMQSKKLDLSNYLAKLDKIAGKQTNELLQMQTSDYSSFVKRLIDIANIMDKRFYISVPFLVPPKMNNPKSSSANTTQTTISYTPEEFKKYKTELDQRVSVVQSGLSSIGVRCALLNTQQIIELLYGVYNPDEATKQKLIDSAQLQGEMVESELLHPQEEKKVKKENE